MTREIDKFRETMKIREAEKEEQDKKRKGSKSPSRRKSKSRERDSESRSRCYKIQQPARYVNTSSKCHRCTFVQFPSTIINFVH